MIDWCDDCSEDLPLYLEDQIEDPEVREAIQDHLLHCSACQEKAEEYLQMTRGLIRELAQVDSFDTDHSMDFDNPELGYYSEVSSQGWQPWYEISDLALGQRKCTLSHTENRRTFKIMQALPERKVHHRERSRLNLVDRVTQFLNRRNGLAAALMILAVSLSFVLSHMNPATLAAESNPKNVWISWERSLSSNTPSMTLAKLNSTPSSSQNNSQVAWDCTSVSTPILPADVDTFFKDTPEPEQISLDQSEFKEFNFR